MLTEMLKMTKRIDREMILSDVVLCSFLSVEAEAVGVTLEEYVDRFLEVFYSEPDLLYSIVNFNS